MKSRWKKMTCALAAACLLGTASAPFVPADDIAPETERKAIPEGQLTMEEIDRISQGKAKVYTHDGLVTLVDGSCASEAVTNMEEAGKVADSMVYLMGGDETTRFDPWDTFTDTAGNHYYVFQQVYGDHTVQGGAVKIITDPDGQMLAFSGSVEAELPEANQGGIAKEEAEQVVLEHAKQMQQAAPKVIEEWTREIILPDLLTVDLESDDTGARYVWAVYTANTGDGMGGRESLPYLAHYVTMAGEYLYNIPTITPGDSAGSTGFETDYLFEFMESVPYTGYVDLSDGTEQKITVDVMRDRRTGMYYLGNLERKIVVADCHEFLYNDGQVVLEYSPDNLEWDQVGLKSLYNYCLAYDYYKEIGWMGADNKSTPILILNNYCDENHMGIDNACYCGYLLGWQIFAASQANDLSQCIDVIAHEFTHCVTHTAMTYNAYMNDYGAINEAMSDIQGQFCKMMNIGAENTDWILGEASLMPARSMKDPHRFKQPEYVWDIYYVENAKEPTAVNDNGGVHGNSSLMNNIAYRLCEEGGMSLDEARAYWFAVDCTMVPKTDYVQLSELLPVVLKNLKMEKYQEVLADAIEAVRISDTSMPEQFGNHQALITLELPDNEVMTDSNWMLQTITIDVDRLVDKITTYRRMIDEGDYSFLPEDCRNEVGAVIEIVKQTTREEGLLSLLTDAALSMFLAPEEETGAQPETEVSPEMEEELKRVFDSLRGWLREETEGIIGQGNASAGQDGRTIKTVSYSGYTIPILMHLRQVEGSMTQVDQVATAVLIGSRWYDISAFAMLAPGEEQTEDPLGDFFNNETVKQVINDVSDAFTNVESLEDIPLLVVTKIREGEVNELPAAGLDTITLPDTPPMDMLASDPVTEGPKSRPARAEDARGEETMDTEESEVLELAA